MSFSVQHLPGNSTPAMNYHCYVGVKFQEGAGGTSLHLRRPISTSRVVDALSAPTKHL